MQKIKAIIFDLDGTLIDTIPFHAESFITLFGLFGHKVKKQKIKHYLRLNTEEIYKKLGAKKTLKLDMKKFLELRRRIYYAAIKGKKTVFNDVFPALQKLKKYRLGIATNSSRKTLLKSTPKGLFKKFDSAISFSEVKSAKPSPEMLLKIAKKLKAKTKECLVIGDSVMDVKAAKKAGMKIMSIYRKTGASTLKELQREKPDFIAKSLSEITGTIKKIEN
ncbi:MAG: HAD family hydrolase [Candidatus ainarchaeum sp.]|nr:HAD family hydrolase [Candidatus ainarchaeum sp.]